MVMIPENYPPSPKMLCAKRGRVRFCRGFFWGYGEILQHHGVSVLCVDPVALGDAVLARLKCNGTWEAEKSGIQHTSMGFRWFHRRFYI